MAITLDTFSRGRKVTWFTLWIRLLAAIGIFLILERTATWYSWDASPDGENTFSAISKLGIHFPWSANATQHVDAAVDSTVKKSIIVASMKREHTEWINQAFPDWEINTYVANDKTANYTVLKNEGHEASTYLTYIINNYYNLPDYMVFIHAQRYQWHNDDPMYDGIQPLKNLQLDSVDRDGYLSLRCSQAPGCPDVDGVHPKIKGKDDYWSYDHLFGDAFVTFFPGTKLPKRVHAPCCAQFAVSKATVQARPVAAYELYREWLWHVDDVSLKTGRVFEYMWHLIFGKPAVYCPAADECYCKNFGLCDLKCPNAPKECLGRFKLVPFMNQAKNKDWPKKGQGIKSWPVDKWWEKFYPPSEYDGFTLRNRSNDTTTKSLAATTLSTKLATTSTTGIAINSTHTSVVANPPAPQIEPATPHDPPASPARPAEANKVAGPSGSTLKPQDPAIDPNTHEVPHDEHSISTAPARAEAGLLETGAHADNTHESAHPVPTGDAAAAELLSPKLPHAQLAGPRQPVAPESPAYAAPVVPPANPDQPPPPP